MNTSIKAELLGTTMMVPPIKPKGYRPPSGLFASVFGDLPSTGRRIAQRGPNLQQISKDNPLGSFVRSQFESDKAYYDFVLDAYGLRSSKSMMRAEQVSELMTQYIDQRRRDMPVKPDGVVVTSSGDYRFIEMKLADQLMKSPWAFDIPDDFSRYYGVMLGMELPDRAVGMRADKPLVDEHMFKDMLQMMTSQAPAVTPVKPKKRRR